MSRNADQKAQESRSRRHNIEIRDDGNVTKPSKWVALSDSQFGDPVNYLYPVPDKAHAVNAKSRFTAHLDKYTDGMGRGIVRSRINRLARKYDVEPIKASADKGEKQLGQPAGGRFFLADIAEPIEDEDSERNGLIRIPAARNMVLTHPWWGVIYLDDDFFESLVDNWQTSVLGFDLSIDKDHDTHSGALAWIEDIDINGDSFDLWVRPTVLGDGQLGDVWRYASIEYTDNYTDPETGASYGPTLFGCAATNRPFVHRQDAIQIMSLGSRECDDWQCRLSIKEEDVPMLELNGGTIEVADPVGQGEEVVGNVPTELATPEPVVAPEPARTAAVPAPVEPVSAAPAEITLNGVTMSAADVASLMAQNAALLDRDHERTVDETCSTALARGVAPAVVNAARQILTATNPLAQATITLTVPGEQGVDVVKPVNLFSSVAELLALIPGYITETPLSYPHQGNAPGAADKSGNPYAADDVMTPEEAEAAGVATRAELSIKSNRRTTSSESANM